MTSARIAGCFLGVLGCAPSALPVQVEVPLERIVLDNGLELIMLPDHHVPEVSVRLRYHVGSKDEAPREQGLSHLLEHLTYTGSAHTERDTYFARMQALGASGVNGSTSYDSTDYFFTVPTGSVAQVLWNERERMYFALDGLDVERATRELHIVESESRLRREETALGHVIDRAIAATVPGNHPYSHGPLGNMSALAALDLHRDVLRYYRAHYAPNRATLVIAGDIDRRQTRTLVARLFGDLPPAAAPLERAVITTPRPDPPRLQFEAPGPDAALVAAWLMPPENSSEYVIARVAFDELASIAQASVRNEGPVEQLRVQIVPRRFASVGVFVMHAREGVPVGRLVETLTESASDFGRYRADGWVGNARSHCIIDQIFDLASNAERADRIAALAGYGKSGEVQGELRGCMQIEASSVESWTSSYFAPAHAVLAFVRPMDSAPPAGREVQP